MNPPPYSLSSILLRTRGEGSIVSGLSTTAWKRLVPPCLVNPPLMALHFTAEYMYAILRAGYTTLGERCVEMNLVHSVDRCESNVLVRRASIQWVLVRFKATSWCTHPPFDTPQLIPAISPGPKNVHTPSELRVIPGRLMVWQKNGNIKIWRFWTFW